MDILKAIGSLLIVCTDENIVELRGSYDLSELDTFIRFGVRGRTKYISVLAQGSAGYMRVLGIVRYCVSDVCLDVLSERVFDCSPFPYDSYAVNLQESLCVEPDTYFSVGSDSSFSSVSASYVSYIVRKCLSNELDAAARANGCTVITTHRKPDSYALRYTLQYAQKQGDPTMMNIYHNGTSILKPVYTTDPATCLSPADNALITHYSRGLHLPFEHEQFYYILVVGSLHPKAGTPPPLLGALRYSIGVDGVSVHHSTVFSRDDFPYSEYSSELMETLSGERGSNETDDSYISHLVESILYCAVCETACRVFDVDVLDITADSEGKISFIAPDSPRRTLVATPLDDSQADASVRLSCDICGFEFPEGDYTTAYHASGILDGKQNNHIHVCPECVFALRLDTSFNFGSSFKGVSTHD